MAKIYEEGKKSLSVEKDNEKLLKALGEEMSEQNPDMTVDADVLAKLKNKMSESSAKEEVPFGLDCSIQIGFVGVGQAGSRVAQVMSSYGYESLAINTSSQDLKYIEIPDSQKLLLEGTLGGTGKDLDLGREIFVENQREIEDHIDKISDNEMFYLCVSGGGGTGSSSVDTMLSIMASRKPTGVIYILPKETDDAKSKNNSIETLSRLASMATEDMISNLIIVDNAKIEQIYSNLSQSEFWDQANKAIVEPLHLFNTLTATASKHTSLDPSDFAKIISSGDCSLYGTIEVYNWQEETALAEAVIESLADSMLAEGFDISQTKVAGVIICGSSEVMAKLPALNINYCYHMISEKTNGASVFQGVYDIDTSKDSVKIITWFAGLGLPRKRIDSLKEEALKQSKVMQEKNETRESDMMLRVESTDTKNVSNEIHRKIQKKKSNFSKLQRSSRGSLIDKRRR